MAAQRVRSVLVLKKTCLVAFEAGPPAPPFGNIAVLWNDTGPSPSPAELVLRSMWLSLVNKAIEQRLLLDVVHDNGVASFVTLVSAESDAQSVLPRTPQELTQLLDEWKKQQGEAAA